VVSAVIVLIYIFLGGLTSAIYNEVLQFFLIVLGFLPLVLLGLKDVGGWSGLTSKLAVVATNAAFEPGAWSHSWKYMDSPSHNPMGMEWFGLVMGLGFALSFGYWCTDFLVVQRAMAAGSMTAARRTPLIAAIPKMLMPALVILPGMLAIGLHASRGGFLPIGDDGQPNYNLAIPMMLAHYLPSGLLGLGLTALMASFMSGMAGNVTAFNSVWTYDIYQTHIRPGQTDGHYLRVGHAATVFGILASVAAAYSAHALQQHSRHAAAGVLVRERAAICDVPAGDVLAPHHGAWSVLRPADRDDYRGAALRAHLAARRGARHQGRVPGRRATYLSERDGAELLDRAVRLDRLLRGDPAHLAVHEAHQTDEELRGLVHSLTPRQRDGDMPWYKRPVTLAVGILAVSALLNVIFW